MRFFVLIIFSLFVVPVHSATWYVRPTTNGTANGTSYGDAWARISSIVWGTGGVTNGDTLYICGTHIKSITNSGFSDGQMLVASGITVRGDYSGDPGVVFCAAVWQLNLETNWIGPDVNGVYNNPTISLTEGGTKYALWFQVDGTNIIRLNVKTNETWTGDLGCAAFIGTTNFVKTTDGSKPNGNLATAGVYGYFFNLVGRSNITFQNLRIVGNCLQNGLIQGANHITFRNCTLLENGVTKYLEAGNDYWTFDGCEIANADYGIYCYNTDDLTMGADYLVVTNCYIHDIDTFNYYYSLGQDAHAVAARMKAANHVVSNNRIIGTGDAICYFGGPQTNVEIYGNLIKDTHVSATGGYGIDIGGSGIRENFKIHNNVIINMATNASVGSDGYGIHSASSSFIEILNNTITNAHIGIHVDTVNDTNPVNARILNNIMSCCVDGVLYLYGVGTTNTTTVDYNLYFTNGLASPFYINPPITRDSHSVYADPLLTTDYHLQPLSPAINAGTNVGFPFYGSAPDIGAYEWYPLSVINANTIRAITLRGKP